MSTIDLDHDTLTIRLEGYERILAFRRELVIPLDQVRQITPNGSSLATFYKGWMIPGTHVMGLYAAGTFHKNNKRDFWHVRYGEQTVTLDLEGHSYDRVILGVEDAHQFIEELNTRIALTT